MINMNYEIKKNLIKIYADNEDYVNLEFFKNKQIRIYKQKNDMNLYEVFLNSKTSKFNVDYKNNKLKNLELKRHNIFSINNKKNLNKINNNKPLMKLMKIRNFNSDLDAKNRDNLCLTRNQYFN